MREFSYEYRALGGYHDGIRARIVDSESQNPLVTHHEAMHARIFRETPDGQIHSAYCLAVESRLLSGGIAAAVAQSSITFFEAARLPHECFATYLSVKLLPAAEEAAALALLAPEYVKYFRVISDVLDSQFKASHLQFLLAWNLAVAVFSSPLLRRFHALDVAVPIELTLDEHPEHRFNSLMHVLRVINMDEVERMLVSEAHRACETKGLPHWDILSEEAWMAATYVNGELSPAGPTAVEFALSESLREWLKSIVPFTFLTGSQLSAAFVGFSDSLRQKLNITAAKKIDEEMAAESLRGHTLRSALDASESRVLNTLAFPLRRPGDLVSRWHELFTSSTIAVYSACPPALHLTNWALFAWSAETARNLDAMPAFYAEFERSEVVSFLAEWVARKERGERVPELRAIVIAVRGLADLVRTLQETDYVFWKYDVFLEKLCWYLWSGFLEVYGVYSARETPLFLAHIHSGDGFRRIAANSSEIWRYNEPVLKVLQFGDPSSIGLFIRAFPMHSALQVRAFEDDLIERGAIRQMPYEAIDCVAPLIKEAWYGVRSLWCEY